MEIIIMIKLMLTLVKLLAIVKAEKREKGGDKNNSS